MYEEAVQRQWSSATDIPWETVQPLPDDVERAMCQLCTFLTEVEFIAGDAPGQWLPKINPAHYETKLFLLSQIMDEARHLDVFRKRALVNGGGLLSEGQSGPSLRVILDAKDFTEMSAIMHVFAEGFIQSLFRTGEYVSYNEAEKRIYRLCYQDESRHLGFGVMHLKYILETGIVDCAIVVSSDEEYHPHAIVARRFTDLQKSMKIKYIWYPVLRDLRAAVADPTINNIAVVGVPCVIRAVRAIQESKLGKYRKKIKLTLGLFCWEIFKYELLPYLIFRHESINVRNLYKIDIKKDMTVETKDGSEFKFDLADTKPYVRNGCSYCGDFTGEWADISVGKAGSPPNYCTVLTRTPLGEEIFRQVCDKKLAETVEFEGGDIFKLKDLLKTFRVAERLSERKRQRWDKK
ncbi:MAG: Coenzyme F420 hydrogenase/dehydrogenase, beta subunit C-terminal domain [Candidatus Hydrothermarchaeota archaeon]